ncbi:MAG: hypothetical protein NC911_10480, partial [Candidatus Omnitrophica bacterium]|nr:hypothetical protein [Candidatus Omnitrophota bacterium]
MTKKAVHIQNRNFEIRCPSDNLEEILIQDNGKQWPLGKVVYHLKYWQQAGTISSSQVAILRGRQARSGRFIREGEVGDIGFSQIQYDLSSDNQLRVECNFTACRDVCLGFYFWGLKPPEQVGKLRLLPGVYSGYSFKPGLTAVFRFTYLESKGIYQAALAVDQERSPYGTTKTAYQYLCLSFPPAYKDGVFRLNRGQSVTGKLQVILSHHDIWNPILKKEEFSWLGEPSYLPARYPYSVYLSNFLVFVRQPGLWVWLGRDQGMYHVGYYGHLSSVKKGGPYGYALNGRPIRYRDLADFLKQKRPGLGHFQENCRQVEIAWGNGTNSMVAYALFHLRQTWARVKARQIIRAILN